MIEIWYKGECWDGSKPEPVKVGEVALVEDIMPLASTLRDGCFEARAGSVPIMQVVNFAPGRLSPAAEALRDLLAVLRSNDRFDPDPAGCLAQAVAAGVRAIQAALEQPDDSTPP